jgi:hypothetical protein
LSSSFVSSFVLVDGQLCTSTANDGRSIGALGIVDFPTTSVPDFVIARLSLIDEQEAHVDGFGRIFLQLTFSNV